jgi:hypothetical protein
MAALLRIVGVVTFFCEDGDEALRLALSLIQPIATSLTLLISPALYRLHLSPPKPVDVLQLKEYTESKQPCWPE